MWKLIQYSEEEDEESYVPSDSSDPNYSCSQVEKLISLSNEKRPWSLRGLSNQILDLMCQLQSSNFKQLQTILTARLKDDFQYLSQAMLKREILNLKRRIYDAINVMHAVRIVVRQGKEIILKYRIQNIKTAIDQCLFAMTRVQSKRQRFKYLTDITILLHKLVERNRDLDPRHVALMQFPRLGMRVNISKGDVELCSKNDTDLLIKSNHKLKILTYRTLLQGCLQDK